MDWRKLLLSPQGRIGRKTFWLWIAISYSVAIVAGTIDAVIFGADAGINPLSSVYALATLYPSICVNVKRLHDTTRSGWWLLGPWAVTIVLVVAVSPFFPKSDDDLSVAGVLAVLAAAVVMLGAFVTLIAWLGFSKGQPAANKYGEPNSGDREVAPVAEVFS
jgi:uncharacterized membrane protein YhaH (DUF805 family)